MPGSEDASEGRRRGFHWKGNEKLQLKYKLETGLNSSPLCKFCDELNYSV
jgi:hypothetical protein